MLVLRPTTLDDDPSTSGEGRPAPTLDEWRGKTSRRVATVAVTEAPAPTLEDRAARTVLAGLRIGLGLLWLQGAGWKNPATFGRDSGFFYDFVAGAVENEVFAPFAWLIDNVVLPNFTLFAWAVFVTEVLLATFLLLGLATRLWALVGAAQSMVILLSVANTPDEWGWSYWLMIAAHLAVFATAAGRCAGLDGVLRPAWSRSSNRLFGLLVKAS